MSPENVEVVRRIYAAAARRDAATIFELYDPAVELDNTRLGFVDGGIFHGHDGLRTFFRKWHEAWADTEYGYDELIHAGDQVIALVTRRGRGATSGVAVELELALLWTVRDGRVTRLAWYPSASEAFAAAGLTDSSPGDVA